MILNWGDCTLGSPVDGVWDCGKVEVSNLSVGLWNSLVTEKLSVFSWGVVSELVGGKGEGVVVSTVVVSDLGHVLLILLESELEFLFGAV